MNRTPQKPNGAQSAQLAEKRTQARRAAAAYSSVRRIKKRGGAYIDSVLKTPLANFGLYAMLLLDIVFLAICAHAGYSVALVACFSVAFAFECIAVLTLLPVPVLQVGVVRRPAVIAPLFAVCAFIEGVWTFSSAPFGGGAVFGILTAARILLWTIAFFLCRKGRACAPVALLAVALALIALCGAGSLFRFSFSSRPIAFAYREATAEHAAGYAVVRVQDGTKNNVKVPERYKGKPVVAWDTGNTHVRGFTRLSLPASVTYINISTNYVRELTACGSGVAFADTCDFSRLRSLRFTGDALPRNLPPMPNGMLNEICVSEELWEAAWQADDVFGDVRNLLAPVTEEGEGYIVYYTDFAQPDANGGDRETVFAQPAQVTRGTGLVDLPAPDLTEKGYAFDGWYAGRYEDAAKVTQVRAAEKMRVYARYYKLYDVLLYENFADNNGVTQPYRRIPYHYASGEVFLPEDAPAREGYAFCGWFPYESDYGNAPFGDPYEFEKVESVPARSTGDKKFYAVYKKLYAVKTELNGGKLPVEIPSHVHEWSEDFVLPDARKEGYTFMGWFSDDAWQEEIYGLPYRPNGEIIDEDITLYAKFNKNYEIAYQTNGGVLPQSAPKTYHRESGSLKLPSPARTGYRFAGWYDSETFAGEKIEYVPVAEEKDLRFYAKWTPITYKLRFNKGNNTQITGALNDMPCEFDAEITLPDCPYAWTGRYFTGWEIDGKIYRAGEKGVFNFTSRQDGIVTVTAQWKAREFTLVFAGFDSSYAPDAQVEGS
ncbi:MAG: InlB B-repeat-containing protein, partial [Clostridiales bacterium]|nr:InlB B-repeat-containing protein [Clostridiales bacterium]